MDSIKYVISKMKEWIRRPLFYWPSYCGLIKCFESRICCLYVLYCDHRRTPLPRYRKSTADWVRTHLLFLRLTHQIGLMYLRHLFRKSRRIGPLLWGGNHQYILGLHHRHYLHHVNSKHKLTLLRFCCSKVCPNSVQRCRLHITGHYFPHRHYNGN